MAAELPERAEGLLDEGDTSFSRLGEQRGPAARNAAMCQITHFGQTPAQLFVKAHAPRLPQHQPLNPELPSASSVSSSPGLFASELRALSLFSGPYARSDGLSSYLRTYGWSVDQIDNDGERGGGTRRRTRTGDGETGDDDATDDDDGRSGE